MDLKLSHPVISAATYCRPVLVGTHLTFVSMKDVTRDDWRHLARDVREKQLSEADLGFLSDVFDALGDQ